MALVLAAPVLNSASPASLPSIKIALDWTNEDTYERIYIYRKPAGGSYSQLTFLSDGTATSYTDSSVADGTTYYYKLKGWTSADGFSDYSNEESGTTPLPAPSGLSGYSNAGGTEAVLSWADNSQHEASFKVYKNGALIYTTAANAEDYTASGLTPGATYSFYIKAYNAAAGYSPASNTLNLTMADPPSKPSNLTATPTATTKIRLNWTDNSDNETGFKVGRSSTGPTSGFSEIVSLGANITTYENTGLTSNVQYWYRVRAHNASGDSAYSNVASAVTLASIATPTNLALTAAKVAGNYGVECVFDDNSELEDNHILEQGTGTFAGEVVTDGGLENWTSETDLDSWYEHIPDGGSSINREDTEKHGGTYAVRFDIDATGHTAILMQEITLTPGAGYKLSIWYKTAAGKTMLLGMRDGTLGAGGAIFLKADGTWQTSDYSWMILPEATAWTECVIEFQAHSEYSAYVIQFGHGQGVSEETSSSFYVDDVSILAGVFSVLATLAPNQTYYHDATAAAGAAYRYRVRAKQGESTYSAYSNEAAITVPDVPSAPTNLAVSECQDTWARLTWTKTSGEVGYSIEQSTTSATEGFAEVMRICDGIGSMKMPGLAASTQHWFRVRAYSGAGNSVYSNVVTVTTRAAYLPSKFEKLIRKSKPKLIFLVEANPLMEIGGWTLTTDQTYTYETEFDEGGAALEALYENGAALEVKSSIATVEATAGTYWHDTTNKKLYVHTADGGDPINALITGSFWLYFTTWQKGATIYNGNYYLPLVAADGIPDISQAIQPYYEGTFAVSSGTVSLINGKIRKTFYFDLRYAKYLWLNRKVKLLAGGEDFIYAEFAAINAGSINAVNIDDRRMSLDLRDARDGLHRDLPVDKYSLDTFPGMAPDRAGMEQPFGFGAIAGAAPTCIDTTNRVFEFHDGRSKSISVTQNGAALTVNVDYFEDFQRSRITLARGLTYENSDTILVNFTGCVNLADEVNVTGAEVFLYICREWLGCRLADMDLDAIYATKYTKPTALSLYLGTILGSEEIIRTIEQSSQASTMQDAEGRLGIRAEQAAPVSGAPYVWNLHVFDFAAAQEQDQLYSAIHVYYNRSPGNDIYALSRTPRPTMTWRHGVNKVLDLYVALAGASDAAALGIAIAGMMERQQISFTVPRVLYTCLPGDVIYFNRTRFPSLSGMAANLPVRILGISKLISSGKTEITAEVV